MKPTKNPIISKTLVFDGYSDGKYEWEIFFTYEDQCLKMPIDNRMGMTHRSAPGEAPA
jgi:hypothetical protein